MTYRHKAGKPGSNTGDDANMSDGGISSFCAGNHELSILRIEVFHGEPYLTVYNCFERSPNGDMPELTHVLETQDTQDLYEWLGTHLRAIGHMRPPPPVNSAEAGFKAASHALTEEYVLKRITEQEYRVRLWETHDLYFPRKAEP
jgi:hypothetical protein